MAVSYWYIIVLKIQKPFFFKCTTHNKTKILCLQHHLEGNLPKAPFLNNFSNFTSILLFLLIWISYLASSEVVWCCCSRELSVMTGPYRPTGLASANGSQVFLTPPKIMASPLIFKDIHIMSNIQWKLFMYYVYIGPYRHTKNITLVGVNLPFPRCPSRCVSTDRRRACACVVHWDEYTYPVRYIHLRLCTLIC